MHITRRSPWKAALLGPYVDFTGLGGILPLIPFFLQDLEGCTPSAGSTCSLTEAIVQEGAGAVSAPRNPPAACDLQIFSDIACGSSPTR